MYLIFGTIYNPSNVIVMQIAPTQSVAGQIVKTLSKNRDLSAVNWHIHPVSYSQDAKQGVSNIKLKLRSINQNRIANPHKRKKALMPSAEKQMLDKFSKRRESNK